MFDSDKIAREKPCPGSEAERVTPPMVGGKCNLLRILDSMLADWKHMKVTE